MTELLRHAGALGTYSDRLAMEGLPFVTTYGGNVFWVCSKGKHGSAGTFSRPVATLAEGLALCAADNDDKVVVKPGHTETITGVGGITMDKGGVKVIGLGRYNSRPTFLMDGAATVTCLVTADNCGVYNCLFKAGHADIVTFSTITGKGCTFEGNQFADNTSGENFISVFNAGAADYDYDGLQLINNEMDFNTDVAVLLPINLLKSSRDVKIIGNKICGDFDTSAYAAIYSVNTLHHFNIQIAFNLIHNEHDANGGICISVGSTTSTGFMHDNLAFTNDVAAATPFVAAAAGLGQMENYHAGDDSTSGYILLAIGAN